MSSENVSDGLCYGNCNSSLMPVFMLGKMSPEKHVALSGGNIWN